MYVVRLLRGFWPDFCVKTHFKILVIGPIKNYFSLAQYAALFCLLHCLWRFLFVILKITNLFKSQSVLKNISNIDLTNTVDRISKFNFSTINSIKECRKASYQEAPTFETTCYQPVACWVYRGQQCIMLCCSRIVGANLLPSVVTSLMYHCYIGS